MREQGGAKGAKHILYCFRVPTTSVETGGEGDQGVRGVKHIVY